MFQSFSPPQHLKILQRGPDPGPRLTVPSFHIAQQDFQVVFEFDSSSKLYRVHLNQEFPQARYSELLGCFKSMQDLLEDRYGPPTKTTDSSVAKFLIKTTEWTRRSGRITLSVLKVGNASCGVTYAASNPESKKL